MPIRLPSSLLLIFIILLAFSLRVYKSGSYGLYLDEKYTMVISQGIAMEGANQRNVFFTPGKVYFTPAEFWQPKNISDFVEANIRGDIGNSPAYYAILWTWMKVFGLSDFSARFPSVLFSTLTVLLLYIFVRRHFQSRVLALLSAFVAAIEPFFVAYSHMARNYSMSFFLTLLATHVFLIIIERRKTALSINWYCVAYGAILVVALLSHYLTVTVFMCHALYMLLFVRELKIWTSLSLAGLVAICVVSLWFIYGGGQYTFQTLAYQAQVYRQAALTNPQGNGFGIILPATPYNVFKQSLPIWTDLFLLSNGLGQPENIGFRHLLLALALGVAALWLVRRYAFREAQRPLWIHGLLAAAILIGFSIRPSVESMIAVCLPLFFYLAYRYFQKHKHINQQQTALYTLILLLVLVPTLFLLLMAFRNGHTYGITQRYSGFSFPYTAILIGMMIYQIGILPMGIMFTLWVVLVLQLGSVGRLLKGVYDDRAPKYTYFGTPRIENPYYTTAQRIEKYYTVGDTVLYPSTRLQFRDDIEKTYSPYSVQDAQLTNLYLSPSAQYIQRMDTTQTDRIILKKAKGGQTTLFDLKGRTFRY